MNASMVIDRMHTAAKRTKNDTESNRISRLTQRLEYYGAVCEKPLSHDEIKQIMEFIKD